MRASFLAILNSLLFLICFFLFSCQSKPTNPIRDQKIEPIVEQTRPERDSTDTTARIYLTFDDGPYTTTPGLMQLLSKKGVRISFFIIGSQIDKSPWHDSVFNAVEAEPNFKVYNHTYSHAVTKGRIHGYYRDPEGVWQDIVKNKSYLPEGVAITRLPGKNTWRTPNRTTRSDKQSGPLLHMLDTLKQPEFIVGWDVEWNTRTSENQADLDHLIRQVEEKLANAPSTKRDVVVLSHDYLYRTPRSLELLSAFIDHFQQKGNVKFDWVQHLPGLESGAARTAAKP